eukprot:GSChrysophyteH1.ASY1.ANO1.476.1 assembled CDS
MESLNGVTCIKGEISSIMTLMRLNTRWSDNTGRDILSGAYQDEDPLMVSFRHLNTYLEGIFDLREVDSVAYLSPYHDSDEVIFMKLLELSALTLRSDASCLLSVGAAWEIYSTCLNIYSQPRASKILKSEAETTLRELTLTAFGRATSMGRGMALPGIGSEWNMDLTAKKQTTEGVKFALSLVNIALEAGGPSLGPLGALVNILRADVCRHLLRASQSDDLAILSMALRVVFNLFVSIKEHMKVQLEVFLTSVHLRLLRLNGTAATDGTGDKKALATARAELALESLLEFCREPSLMADLYTNYDCDVTCTNLFHSIIDALCARAVASKGFEERHNGLPPR